MNDMGVIIPVVPDNHHVSAIMRIDDKVNPEYLGDALESLFAQSVPPEQLILLCSNVIKPAAQVIERYMADPRIQVEIIELAATQGLATAMNAALGICTGEWIMFVYPEGVSHPDRLAIQLDYVDHHPDIDVFSTWSEEYDDHGHQSIKASAIQHPAVVASMRWRNVLVHSSILVRATALQRVGGYRAKFRDLEAYDLFVRLALAGARFRVIPAELVRVHVDHSVSLLELWTDARFRVFCWRSGFVTVRQAYVSFAAHVMFALACAVSRGRPYWMVRTPMAPQAVQIRWLVAKKTTNQSAAVAQDIHTFL
jgi:glycosyltransferase involved in cell wall biosynthesis